MRGAHKRVRHLTLPWSLPFVLCLSVLCFACEPQQQQGPTAKAFLAPCTADADCADRHCVQVSEARRICTKPCAAQADCPGGSTWSCAQAPDKASPLCLCQADGLELCGDGLDNDCNGKIDDCLSQGQACDADSACDDGNACTQDLCRAGRCAHPLAEAPCAPGESCNLWEGHCKVGEACAVDADCDDGDACTAQERCDPVLRVCISVPLDGDKDGDAPRICGGYDCNDDDPRTHAGAAEMCDRLDNDCDGQVDEEQGAALCADSSSCVDGECRCSPALTSCSDEDRCVDLQTSAEHCGRCDVQCASGQVCEQGNCACQAGQVLCAGACRSSDWFESNPDHCGGCGQTCEGQGAACMQGACTCPGSFDLLCDGKCLHEPEQLHCGSCGNACALCTKNHDCVQVAKLFVGMWGACALMTSSELFCWGEAGSIFLGPGARRVEKPQRVPLRDVVDVQLGYEHVCALTNTGEVWCWGLSNQGQIGNGISGYGDDAWSPDPVRVQREADVPLGEVVELSARHGFHSCARLKSGEVYCWGRTYTDLGTYLSQPWPVRVDMAPDTALSQVAKLFPGQFHDCALLQNSELYCWGTNDAGRLGVGEGVATSGSARRVETAPGVPLAGVTQVALGSFHTCAITNNAEAYCWGYNSTGQLGNGQTGVESLRPVRVETSPGTPLSDVDSIQLGKEFTCARRKNGEVYCWGDNSQKQLGTGESYASIARPARVGLSQAPAFLSGGLLRVSAAPSDNDFACALGTGSEPPLSCWGDNTYGQLGDGTLNTRGTPSAISPLLRGVVDVGLGMEHGCALLESGLVYCWGRGHRYQLGVGSPTSGSTPQLVRWLWSELP